MLESYLIKHKNYKPALCGLTTEELINLLNTKYLKNGVQKKKNQKKKF